MELYLLWISWGDYDDKEDHLLGVYSSLDERQAAIKRYESNGNCWIFKDGKPFASDAQYTFQKTEINKDIYLEKPLEKPN